MVEDFPSRRLKKKEKRKKARNDCVLVEYNKNNFHNINESWNIKIQNLYILYLLGLPTYR